MTKLAGTPLPTLEQEQTMDDLLDDFDHEDCDCVNCENERALQDDYDAFH